jgi:hypothetical protein
VVSVLRGLMVDEQKFLIKHLQKKYDKAGKQLFQDGNAWTALSATFGDLLHDLDLGPAYLIVVALDECDSGCLSS